MEDSLLHRITTAFSRLAGSRRGDGTSATRSAHNGQTERRLVPRYRVEGLEETGDVIAVSFEGAVCEVYDLSSKGLCFTVERPLGDERTGDEVNATVDLCGDEIPVILRIASQRDKRVGCEVVSAPPAWQSEVKKLLDPLHIGQQLQEVDMQDLAKKRTPSQVRWFRGGPVCDLYVWTDDEGSIERVQLFFTWQCVEWSAEAGLRSARAHSPPDREPEPGTTHSDSYELRAPPDSEALTTARRILAASKVPWEILQLFEA